MAAIAEIEGRCCRRLHTGLFLLLFLTGRAVVIVGLVVIAVVAVGLGSLGFLLCHIELLPCLAVERHKHNVVLVAPAAMAAIAIAAGGICHGLAVHCPAGLSILISAFGKVDYFRTVGSHKSYVLVVPAANTYIINQQPVSVRTPLKGDVAVGVAVVEPARQDSSNLFGIHIDNAKCSAVLEECHTCAVGTEFRLLGSLVGAVERLLYNVGGVGETLVVIVGQTADKELPAAIALGIVHQRTPVGGEIHTSLLPGSVGYSTEVT